MVNHLDSTNAWLMSVETQVKSLICHVLRTLLKGNYFPLYVEASRHQKERRDLISAHACKRAQRHILYQRKTRMHEVLQ